MTHDPDILFEGTISDLGIIMSGSASPPGSEWDEYRRVRVVAADPAPTDERIEPLPGLTFPRCTYEAMGRRCSQVDEHQGTHRLQAERTVTDVAAADPAPIDSQIDRIRDWLQVDRAFLREPTELERRARELFEEMVRAADPAPADLGDTP